MLHGATVKRDGWIASGTSFLSGGQNLRALGPCKGCPHGRQSTILGPKCVSCYACNFMQKHPTIWVLGLLMNIAEGSNVSQCPKPPSPHSIYIGNGRRPSLLIWNVYIYEGNRTGSCLHSI